MARYDLAARRPHQLLQPLRALEPRWVVSCEPALGDAVAPLVDCSLVDNQGFLGGDGDLRSR